MQSYTLNRPDGALLRRVLEQHTNDAAGAILRLAWMAGLMRDEIQHLTWAQVDLLGEQLLLPDRAVPLDPELAAWLEALRRERNGSSERVVLSDRDQQPLAAQSISRLARAALDAGGLKAVRLIDLRHDYVLRQLEHHDWQYVSRITGLEAAAMNVHFAAYLTEKKVSTRIRRKTAPQIDEFALWKLLQAEQDSPAGAALWLTWQLGLQVEEIASLRWDQVDLQKERLILPDRQVRLTSGVLAILQKLRKAAPPEAEWVLMSPRSRRPHPPVQAGGGAGRAPPPPPPPPRPPGGGGGAGAGRAGRSLPAGPAPGLRHPGGRREPGAGRCPAPGLHHPKRGDGAPAGLQEHGLQPAAADGGPGKADQSGKPLLPAQHGGAAGGAGAGDPGVPVGGGVCLPPGHCPGAADRPPPVLAHPPADAGRASDRQGRAEIHPLAEGGVRPDTPGFPPLSFLEIRNFCYMNCHESGVFARHVSIK